MLQNIRNKSGGLIIKIILVLIGLSFLSWGVNDVLRMLNSTPPIVKVDKKKIGFEEFEYKLKKLISVIKQNNNNKEVLNLRNYAFCMNFLNSLIDEEVIKTEPKEMGFLLNKSVITNLIKSEKSFENAGKFDENIFREYVSKNGKSINEVFSETESNLIMNIITNGILSNVTLPNEYLSILWKTFSRKKTFEIACLDPQKIEFNKKISDRQLISWVEKNKALYTAEEERNAKILIIDYKIIAKDVAVNEEEINASYDSYKREQLLKMKKYFNVFLIRNFNNAKKIAAELNIGQTNDDIRHSFPEVKIDENVALLKKQISKDLLEKIWDLNKNEASEPILVGEDYVVIQFKNAGEIEVKELSQLREEILMEIKLSKSQNKLEDVKNQIEDMLAANKKIDEISNNFRFSIANLSGVTKENYSKKLKQFSPEVSEAIFKIIFETEQNSVSAMVETNEKFAYVLETTSVKKEAVEDFQKIKGKVMEDYIANKKEETLMKKMKKIVRSSKTINEWKKSIIDNNLEIITESASIFDVEKKSEMDGLISKFSDYKLREILLTKVGKFVVEKMNNGKIAIMRCVNVKDMNDSILYVDSYHDAKKIKDIFKKNHVIEVKKNLPFAFRGRHNILINYDVMNKKILKEDVNEEDVN